MNDLVIDQESASFDVLLERLCGHSKHLMQGRLSGDLEFFEGQLISLGNLTQVIEVDLAVLDRFKVRSLAFIAHHAEIEQNRIDFELVDELTLLVDKFSLKFTFVGIVELLGAHQEPV